MIGRGAVLDDRYELDDRLGIGGSGEVWRAHDRTLRRDVAVKVVPPDVDPARLRREARAAARVTHPNVVGVYDTGEIDGRAYLVMELVDGVDLAAVVRHRGPLPADALAVVAHDLGRALAAVHTAGLVHRDVSPGNVLVTRDGYLKLTDLGTARVAGDDDVDRVTRAGVVVGTVDYLAPEQLGPDPVTAATDVYAAGLVLRTCATADRPFGGGTVSERAARRLTDDPPPVTGAPRWVADLVAATVQRSPTARPADGRELVSLCTRVAPPVGDGRATLAGLVPTTAAATGGTTLVDDADRTTALDDGARTTALDDGARTTALDDDARTTALDDDARTTALDVGAEGTVALPSSRVDRDEAPTPPRDAPPPPRDAPPSAGGAPPPVPSPSDGRRRGRRSSRAVVALLALAAVVALVVAVTGDDGGGGGGADGDGGDGATAFEVVAATDHDPLGSDGEHPAEAPRAIDGDPGTGWTTQQYNSAALGGLKEGVGLVLDLGETRAVRSVEVLLGIDDVDLEVYVSPDAPTGPPATGGTLLGSVEGASGTVEVAAGDPVEGRWVTLWFTGLGQRGSRFQADVREVVVGP